jgi:hypothetical protein
MPVTLALNANVCNAYRGHDDVAVMTASEIGDWYCAEMAKH